MTTIACNGRTIAADSLSTCGDTISGKRTKKLHKLTDGSIIGAAGGVTHIYRALDAIGNGTAYKGNYTLLRLFPDGTLLKYEGCTHPIPEEAPAAIGSGWVAALTAMDCGATPKEAVKAAMKRDVYTGGRVMEMSV